MKAILSRIKVNKNEAIDEIHSIIMFFVPEGDAYPEYVYKTNIETQFGLSFASIKDDATLKKYIDTIEKNIGKAHDINLYDITFDEMTKGKFKGYKYDSYYSDNPNKVYSEFHVATYKTRSDAIFDRISLICTICFQGEIVGVKANGEEEVINDPKRVFFEDVFVDDSAKYNITIDMLSSVSTEFIKHKADLNVLRAGVLIVNKEEFSDCRHVRVLTDEIDIFRKKCYEVKRVNSSLRKKLFFWEDPEPHPKLNISEKEINYLKVLYLNETKFPEKSNEIRLKSFNEAFGTASSSSYDSKKLRDYLINESRKRLQKYHVKKAARIKVVE